MYRLKQVKDAIFGRLSTGDWEWVRAHLNNIELNLFCRLDQVDQYHSIQVAKTGLELARQSEQSVDHKLVIKAGLLHDLGKTGIQLNLFQRILPVVITALLPRLSYRIGQTADYQGWLKGFAVYWNHGARGGEIAARAKLNEKIIEIIINHQEVPDDNNNVILTIIKAADSLH